MLDYLFNRFTWKNHIVFKGGTSLSKAYHLIERFSEDIDLILDWRLLGYKIDEPWQERSNTQQDKFSDRSRTKTINLLSEKFTPIMKKELASEISGGFDLFLESTEDSTINFAYPQLFADASILQVIRLEFGVLASWSPSKNTEVKSFAAEKYPQILKDQVQ